MPVLHLARAVAETTSATVLIASPGNLSSLRQGALVDALAFSATDTLAALDAIKSRRPSLIALEDRYAATARGCALIARVEADPALQACQIRIVADVSESAPPIPMTGTRHAPRFKVIDCVDVRIDSRAASLVDVSVLGAQVVSMTLLKPNQRCKIAFRGTEGTVTPMTCGVAWVSMEIIHGTPRYRAGIEFSRPDTAAIERLIDTTRR